MDGYECKCFFCFFLFIIEGEIEQNLIFDLWQCGTFFLSGCFLRRVDTWFWVGSLLSWLVVLCWTYMTYSTVGCRRTGGRRSQPGSFLFFTTPANLVLNFQSVFESRRLACSAHTVCDDARRQSGVVSKSAMPPKKSSSQETLFACGETVLYSFFQPGVVLLFTWNSSLAVLRQTVLRHPTVLYDYSSNATHCGETLTRFPGCLNREQTSDVKFSSVLAIVKIYGLVQWNWFSDVTVCVYLRCMQWRQIASFTAPGCTYTWCVSMLANTRRTWIPWYHGRSVRHCDRFSALQSVIYMYQYINSCVSRFTAWT